MELAAYSTVAMTLVLVTTRPKLGPRLRVTPAAAAILGAAIMMALGIVTPNHLGRAALELWSPLLAIAAIMVMTEVASRIGLLDLWASWVDSRAKTATQLFTLVFVAGVATSAALSNDAAILLLTPLVVALVRRRYPARPQLVVPFAFAVFASAGVAALPVSNPMNMVVSEYTGIGINAYAARMVPVAILCWILGYVLLRLIFRRQLAGVGGGEGGTDAKVATDEQRVLMTLLGLALVSYPIIGVIGGPIFAVPIAGAIAALFIAKRYRGEPPLDVLGRGVSWGILVFLVAVLVLAKGLFEVGLTGRLQELYAGSSLATIGAVSAVGSAVLNNHPMSHLNMIALEGVSAPDVHVLAALIGGDLGPRLLPIGSLAGLLWIELLRRRGVSISLGLFCKVGIILMVPTLVAALALLSVL